jgi:multiple sugar transport system permease protein
MKRILGRIIIYALLLGGSVVFMTPLIWMISTALKPIDQTMSLPPVWVPYRLYIEEDGQRVSVKERETIDMPAYVVLNKETDQRLVVDKNAVENDTLVRRDHVGVKHIPIEILQDVPASKEDPYIRIVRETETREERAVADAEWQVVAKSSLIKEVAPRWANFGKAIKAMKMFPQYLKNTLILCLLTVIGTVFSSSLAAYGFARIPWRGRKQVFLLCLATMMIPFPVVMVPVYCMFRWLGWVGTLRPLWVITFFAQAWNVFLLRQFFLSIPKDLSDAARIDGCNEWRIYWQIILPLCKPALMVIGLFQFMATWNDFLGPLIYLTDQKDYTLALGLQFFQSQHGGTEWHYLMAASTLVGVPIIILFFFTQRTFIEGISMTGLKG